jgi:hypothetical protein
VLLALVAPAAALAKGPAEATITGPELSKPLRLSWQTDSRQGSPMDALVRHGGFFQVAWGGQPGRTLARSPSAQLGPRYEIVYLLPGPTGRDDRIRQDFYPFAQGGPLTYTHAGQRFFGTRRTLGGWFRTAPALTAALRKIGLPADAPRTPPAAADDASPPIGLLALVAALALAGIAAVAFRRRARLASA